MATKQYKISYTDGSRPETHETYEAAVASLRAEYGPDAVVGHDGDLEGYGDRTLCWETEAESIDDDGARAVASISVEGNDLRARELCDQVDTLVGSDGTVDLRTIVDCALADDPEATAEDVAGIVREARAEAIRG